MKKSILNYENELLTNFKKEQLCLMERMKITSEIVDVKHTNYMKEQDDTSRADYLKAFEIYAYDKFNMDLAQKNELIERLRIANDLLKANGIEIVE